MSTIFKDAVGQADRAKRASFRRPGRGRGRGRVTAEGGGDAAGTETAAAEEEVRSACVPCDELLKRIPEGFPEEARPQLNRSNRGKMNYRIQGGPTKKALIQVELRKKLFYALELEPGLERPDTSAFSWEFHGGVRGCAEQLAMM